ncbi:MAG TPA: glycoside hydrolase family 172 protein, partial [Tepidisphaeraceae bacterium]|nr:glycoside hydrolase family 172 protein [Tepidisphaeraceae bacterium]
MPRNSSAKPRASALGLLLTLLLAGCSAHLPESPELLSPLSSLPNPHPGRAMHEGSWDRSGGNADARPVKPGETITLLDYKGAGIIHRFWVTIAPRADQKIHAQAILRMYWDDSPTPCVEAPIGAFFGVGFGMQKDYISLPLNETSGGYNCYWPMPFHKHARWTLTNLSNKRISAFYYNIDFTAFDSLPADLKHFHASFRRENPTTPNKNYTLLEAEGDGHFVGTALFMQALKPRGLGFLEGDETIYIDQPKLFNPPLPEHSDQKPRPGPIPQIIGTGTEDYFSSGWYFDHGTYSAPYHGVIIKDELASRISAYRWHIEDAMPFHKNIRVSIEHGTNNDRPADYSSVAYFYQSEPHKPYPPLPTNLMPTEPPVVQHFKNTIEAESLLETAKPSAGNLGIQEMSPFQGSWSGDAQLWWTNTHENDTLTLQLPAPADGT